MKKTDTRKLTTLAMICSLAFLVMATIKIPVVLFLKYEPKDVIITIGGFLYGPLAAALCSLVVSIIEMLTVSETGIIGCTMNFISTCAFVCPAAFIYQKRKSLSGAVIGLIVGCVGMTLIMLLWNYLITPLYMGVSRDQVAGLLLPAFLPFNLLKGTLNASFTMLLYKPLVTALRSARLLNESSNKRAHSSKVSMGVMLCALAVIVTCVIIVLVWTGVI